MEKEVLLKNIRETRKEIKKLQNVHSHLQDLYKEPFNFGCVIHIVGFIAYWLMMTFSIIFILDMILSPLFMMLTESAADVIGTVIVVVIMIFSIVTYPYAFNFVQKKYLHKRQNDDVLVKRETINNLELEKQEIIQYIEAYSIIPADYRYVSALNTFEKYLVNYRADNLKECINLFEQEIRHDEQINEIRLLQEMQMATYQKANEAATVGWINILTRR